jgi:hypothetical protein
MRSWIELVAGILARGEHDKGFEQRMQGLIEVVEELIV